MINNHKSTLLQQPQHIFHTQDLAMLWSISNQNTLYTTIKRYCQRKILHRIYKGLYATLPVANLDPRLLGLKAIHSYAYISCETILAQFGVINANISDITLISDQSKQFTIQQYSYRSRQLHDRFLYNPIGIEQVGTIRQASVERAVADLLYFNPQMHFDAPISWKNIQQLQAQIGYPITKRTI
ncbi:MAG: hypothetical protein ACD_72C00407G0003 [uncultured bacterium]|nr:MAG: hypothetical protein ACD_72C00407G0003 [uncultured bacterium]